MSDNTRVVIGSSNFTQNGLLIAREAGYVIRKSNIQHDTIEADTIMQLIRSQPEDEHPLQTSEVSEATLDLYDRLLQTCRDCWAKNRNITVDELQIACSMLFSPPP